MLDDTQRDPSEFTTDDLADVAENVTKNAAVLVDVRSDEEWRDGHIRGAVFLPVTDLCEGCNATALANLLPHDAILYTYCRVGVRAKVAAFILQQQGFAARALEPGFTDLIKAGFPLERGQPPFVR